MNPSAKKRYKDIPFPFVCPITNRSFDTSKGLSCYVTKTLKIEHEVYYDTYINHRDNTCFFCGGKGLFISISKGYRNLCQNSDCVKKSFNSCSVEGIMYKEMCSKDEAEILFKQHKSQVNELKIRAQDELRKSDPSWDKKRSRNCKEFWLNKGFSEEEALEKTKEVMKEVHEKTSFKLKSNKEKYKTKYPTKVEYYVNKGFSIDEAKKIISERQKTFSLDICVQKYGQVMGEKVFKERQYKWMSNLDSKPIEEKIEISRKKLMNHSGFSKISQKLFWSIFDNFQNNNIRFEELNSEIVRYDKEYKMHYKYDFVDFTTKKCIEFNGDYWHCNPNKYDESFIHPVSKIKALDVWKKDELKIKWMEDRGFKVMTVWEHDYKENPQQVLNKCIEFIHE